jgi:gamma-glutamyltranspeptidase/glutathione hydrolase/leukotriene-C4 hydrolase
VAFDQTVLYLQLVPHGSVATDSAVCSVVGTDIMKNGGNAVDAAVAATFCLGVVNPHVTGLGG